MGTLTQLKRGDKIRNEHGVIFTVDYVQDDQVVAWIDVDNRRWHHGFAADEIEVVQQ